MSTSQPTTALDKAQALNALRLRAVNAKGGFLKLGTVAYVPFVESQAVREGLHLTPEAKLRVRQIMNANVFLGDEELIGLIERALNHQMAA